MFQVLHVQHPGSLRRPYGPSSLHRMTPPLILQVESFWLSDNLPGQLGQGDKAGSSSNGVVEMPWWAYGPRGMQLFFPSSLLDPLTPRQVWMV